MIQLPSACWCLLFFTFLSGCSGRCGISVNGYCYDQPNSQNPGLTASWEMIDVDTGKPLKDVWISFYWRKYPDGQSRGSECARNVIGRTDAQGRFSNTAQDGSWIISGLNIYKPGYYPLSYPRDALRTSITDTHTLYDTPFSTYAAWEQRLKTMGYVLDNSRTYKKDFELGGEYARIFDQFWMPKGERRYWVSQRGFPPNIRVLNAGEQCPAKDRGFQKGVESVGYDDIKNQRAYLLKSQSLDYFRWICDDAWDSVQRDYTQSNAAGIARGSVYLLGELTHKQLANIYLKYFSELELHSTISAPLEIDARKRFCADLQPYTLFGEAP